MFHALFNDTRLYVALLEFDRDLRDQCRAAGCSCGGKLHVADFPRKPRGAGCKLPAGYDRRLSLCCAQEGCRHRATPPSVRFLGRRVYLEAVFVLACAMRHGLCAQRVAQLRQLIGVSRRTLERWRRWWLEVFRTTPFWKGAQGQFASPVEVNRLPASLLERFQGGPQEQLVATLKFLLPLNAAPPAADSTGQLR